jgi:hypothetical protein
MKDGAVGQALDGFNLAAMELGTKEEAGIYSHAVYEDRACATLSNTASFLGALESQSLAENGQGSFPRVHLKFNRFTVEHKRNPYLLERFGPSVHIRLHFFRDDAGRSFLIVSPESLAIIWPGRIS